jgi:hypothetical protein
MGQAVTRRGFLARSAAVVSVLAAAGVGGTGLMRAAAGRPGLSAARRRTYVALVDAVGRASRSQVDPAQAPFAARRLSGEYAGALDPTRAGIDDVLDRLEHAPSGRQFSALDPAARIAVLRRLADGESDLAGRAVSLAAAPFHPNPTPVIL